TRTVRRKKRRTLSLHPSEIAKGCVSCPDSTDQPAPFIYRSQNAHNFECLWAHAGKPASGAVFVTYAGVRRDRPGPGLNPGVCAEASLPAPGAGQRGDATGGAAQSRWMVEGR